MRVPKGTPLVSIPSGGGSGNRRFNIGLGRPMMQANANAEMFRSGMDWTLIGKGVADVAKATSMIVQENLKKDAETRANNAYAALASEANDHLYGETGIFTRKGVNASTVVADTRKFYEQAMQRHVKGMNPAAASLFNQMAERSRMSVQTAVARHESDEMRAAQFESIKATIVADQQMAWSGFANDDTYNKHKVAVEGEAARLAAFNGMDKQAATQFVKQAVSETDLGRIQRLITNGQLVKAAEMADSESLLPMHQDKAKQTLKAEYKRIEAEHKAALAERNRQASVLMSNEQNYLAYAMEKGDFGPLDSMVQQLAAMGMSKEAAALQEEVGIYQEVFQTLRSAEPKTFAERRQELSEYINSIERPDNAKMVYSARDRAMAAIDSQEKAYRSDPAAYADSLLPDTFDNPLLRIGANASMQQSIDPLAPVRVLPNAAVNNVNTMLNRTDLSETEKLQQLTSLVSGLGPYGNKGLEELNLPPAVGKAVTVMMETSDNAATAIAMFSASTIKDSDLPKSEYSPTEVGEFTAKNDYVQLSRRKSLMIPADQALARETAGIEKMSANMIRMGDKEALDNLGKGYTIIMEGNQLLDIPNSLGVDGNEASGGLNFIQDNARNYAPHLTEQQADSLRQHGIWIRDGDNAVLRTEWGGLTFSVPLRKAVDIHRENIEEIQKRARLANETIAVGFELDAGTGHIPQIGF